MGSKLKVAILCGGQSAEHEISLLSARNVVEALDSKKYDVILIGITKSGTWIRLNHPSDFLNSDDPSRIGLPDRPYPVGFLPGSMDCLWQIAETLHRESVDVFFPLLHGPMGEDGTLQGLLRLLQRPFVGAGVLGSALGMDKDVMKRLLREANLPTADYMLLRKPAHDRDLMLVSKKIGFPCFVKPANMGSSVGISRVNGEKDFRLAVDRAFAFDVKVIVEQAIEPVREIECSVLGNEAPEVSLPGEIVPRHRFYSYEAKYLDAKGAELKIPALLDQETIGRAQDLARKAYVTLECEGMARVDLFLRPDGGIYLNEINTIPGFTRISMYPKLWEASGLSYANLLDRLIQLAITRHERLMKIEMKPNF